MLIIPANKPLHQLTLPWLSILLILANILVFVLYQGHDDIRWRTALEYYRSSGLAERELPEYLRYLHERAGIAIPGRLSLDNALVLSVRLNQDEAFLEALHANRIIPRDAPDYGQWHSRRERFESLRNKVSAYAYGLVPADASPLRFVSYSFMHGSWSHLLGNMLFLLIFGLALESALGVLRFFLVYLVAGIAGGILHLLINSGGYQPLVGASGAISGLMGAFALWFGRERMQFFYWVGFFFGYLRLPALILLPIWLGKELLDAGISRGSGVAYFAHVGGLLVGAGMTWLWRRQAVDAPGEVAARERTASDKTGQRPASSDYPDALAAIQALRFDEARRLLNRLLDREPAHGEALRQLYHVERIRPDSDAYHQLARRIFALPHKRRDIDELVLDVYRDYRERAQPRPRYTAEILQLLAARLLRLGDRAETERIIQQLEQQVPGLEGNRQLLLELGRIYFDENQKERAFDCWLRLEQLYRDSDQGQQAVQLLNRHYPKYLS